MKYLTDDLKFLTDDYEKNSFSQIKNDSRMFQNIFLNTSFLTFRKSCAKRTGEIYVNI